MDSGEKVGPKGSQHESEPRTGDLTNDTRGEISRESDREVGRDSTASSATETALGEYSHEIVDHAAQNATSGRSRSGAEASGPQTRGKGPETPKLCVDLIIDMGAGLVALIERKNEPHGWALPGGFVDIGETVEHAAIREAREETGLDVELIRVFNVYSDPKRDPRGHTASVVFLARGLGRPRAGSDAGKIELFHEMNLPSELAFDHRQILRDYFLQRY